MVRSCVKQFVLSIVVYQMGSFIFDVYSALCISAVEFRPSVHTLCCCAHTFSSHLTGSFCGVAEYLAPEKW